MIIARPLNPGRPRAVRWIVPVRVGFVDTGRTEYLNAYGEDREAVRRAAGHDAADLFPGEYVTVDSVESLIHIGD